MYHFVSQQIWPPCEIFWAMFARILPPTMTIGGKNGNELIYILIREQMALVLDFLKYARYQAQLHKRFVHPILGFWSLLVKKLQN